MTTPVDWELAARVGVKLAERGPLVVPAKLARMEAEFAEHTARAEELVAEATGLRSLSGPARARVVDRPAWVQANVASFQRLLRPLTDKVGAQLATARTGTPLQVARRVTGAEVGVLLGWMSARVLGQYDLLVVEGEDLDAQDLVYYVGTNVLALEERFGFPREQFRLWLALHEVTHRAQFTGVPWLRDHFLSLVTQVVGGIDPDPQRFLATLKRAVGEVRSGTALQDGGLAAVFASPEQRAVLEQIGGMMSLLEGHGDVTMDRAGAGLVPEAERFSRVLRERRRQQNPAARMVQRLIGLEAKLNQYEQGERFLAAIEAAAGPRAVDRAWEGPDHLPSLAEIREPGAWLTRMGLQAA